jgi:glycosyltransferase involved in cell wall biosynthesis
MAVDQEKDGKVKVYLVKPTHLPIIRGLLLILSSLLDLGQLREIRCGWGLIERSLAVWLKVWELAHREPFDLINAPDFGALALFGELWPFYRTPICIRGHRFLDIQSSDVRWCGSRFHHHLEKFCVHRADFLLVVSQYLYDRYVQEFKVENQNIAVLPCGFHSEFMGSATQGTLRKSKNWSSGNVIVLFVGRIEYQKGCDLLFDALIYCHKNSPSLRAVLLGRVSKDFQAQYEGFMSQASAWAYHPGPVAYDEVTCWMREADILVLPSRAETFGRVIVEAYLHALPVITTRVEALPEVVEDGRTGLLIEPDRSDDLARAILELGNDKPKRIEMGHNGRKLAQERFNFDQVISKEIQIYQSLIDGRPPNEVLSLEGELQ